MAVIRPIAGLIYRLARADDLAELARLRWEFSSPDLQAAQPLAEFLPVFADFWEAAQRGGNWRIFVAERPEGGLAGTVFLQIVVKVPRPSRPNKRFGYITNVYLEPQHRGQGAGARLMEMTIQAARELRLEMLVLWPAERAVPFYRRLGFRRGSEAMELELE